MSAHTPGPWSIYRGEDSAIGVGSMADRRLVCRVDPPFTKRPDAEIDANARLIAAAPEMLALLRETPNGSDALAIWFDKRFALLERIDGARATVTP